MLDAHTEDPFVAAGVLAFLAVAARSDLHVLRETVGDSSYFGVSAFASDSSAAVSTVLAAMQCHAFSSSLTADGVCVLHWLCLWGVDKHRLRPRAASAAFIKSFCSPGGVHFVAGLIRTGPREWPLVCPQKQISHTLLPGLDAVLSCDNNEGPFIRPAAPWRQSQLP